MKSNGEIPFKRNRYFVTPSSEETLKNNCIENIGRGNYNSSSKSEKIIAQNLVLKRSE